MGGQKRLARRAARKVVERVKKADAPLKRLKALRLSAKLKIEGPVRFYRYGDSASVAGDRAAHKAKLGARAATRAMRTAERDE